MIGKISYQCERKGGPTVTMSFPDDTSIDGYVEYFQQFLLAVGFHADTVAGCFGDQIGANHAARHK